MKNISKILFIAAMAIATVACSREEDNLFDKSSAARATEAISNLQGILTSPENGWIMSYFPQSSQKFGGYTFLLKFGTDGTVTAAGEITQPGVEATSLYQINQSAGVTLCFDTYNEVLSSFSDPEPRVYGSAGSGMGGDNDFLVISAEADKVVLKGKKSGSYSTLVPMTSSDWLGYLTALDEAEEAMKYSSYNLIKGDTTIPVSASYRTFTFTCTDEEGKTKEEFASYIQTATGFKLYEPVEIMGIQIDEFIFDPNTETFSVAGDNSAILEGVTPPLGVTFGNSSWFLSYEGMGPWTKAQFDTGDQALKSAEGESLEYVLLCNGPFIGYSPGWGFTFIVDTGYAGQQGLTATPIGESQVSLLYNSKNQGDGDYYLRNCSFSNYLNVFGYNKARTFDITADSKKAPTTMKLTEVGNADNWFIVTVDEVTYK